MKLREGYSAAFCTVKHIRTRIVLLAQPKSTRLVVDATQLIRGWPFLCFVSESEFLQRCVAPMTQKMAQMAMCQWPMCQAIM